MSRVQTSFFDKPKLSFGGSLLKGNPRAARPLDSKAPIHLVLRSEKARGARSMRHPKNFRAVNELVRSTAKKHGVRIYNFANAGNHLHGVVKIHSRRLWARFIRELSGRLAQKLQALGPNERGAGSFWDARPFTRVASWGRDYKELMDYVFLNTKEIEGFITRDEQLWLKALRRQLGRT